MNEFTVTSEVKKLDEFDEKLIVKQLQSILVNIAIENERKI